MSISPEELIMQADLMNVRREDVIIFEPSTLIVYHYRKDGSKRLESPVKITLECGCTCEV
jgi:hypothetical protein